MEKQASLWKLLGNIGAGTGIGAATGYASGDTLAGAQLGAGLGLANRFGLSKLFKPQHYAAGALGGGLAAAGSDNKKGDMLLGTLAGLGIGKMGPAAWRFASKERSLPSFMTKDLKMPSLSGLLGRSGKAQAPIAVKTGKEVWQPADSIRKAVSGPPSMPRSAPAQTYGGLPEWEAFEDLIQATRKV